MRTYSEPSFEIPDDVQDLIDENMKNAPKPKPLSEWTDDEIRELGNNY
ncbi:MAG: hypothetical protein HUJ68_09995 [Clostridia bacterium]|nr:hypothetical protein [Clostridia bacterium]